MENLILPPSQGGDNDPLTLDDYSFDTFEGDGYENILQDHEFPTLSTQREYSYPTRSPLDIHNASLPNMIEDGPYSNWARAQQNEDRFDHVQGSSSNTHQFVNPLGNSQQVLRIDRDHDNMIASEPARNSYVYQQGYGSNDDYSIGYRQQSLQPNSHPQPQCNTVPNIQYAFQQGPQPITLPHHPTMQGGLGPFTTSISPRVSVDQNVRSYNRNIPNFQDHGMQPTLQWRALRNPTLAQQRMMAETSSTFELQIPNAGTSKRHRNVTKPQEPDHLVGKDIPCQHCPSIDTTFKYFCNKKETQPRYVCNTCKKFFTYNGKKYKKVKGITDSTAMIIYKPPSNEYGKGKRKMDFEETEATTSDSSVENEDLESLYQFKRTGPNPFNLRSRVTSIDEHETGNSEGCEDTSEISKMERNANQEEGL